MRLLIALTLLTLATNAQAQCPGGICPRPALRQRTVTHTVTTAAPTEATPAATHTETTTVTGYPLTILRASAHANRAARIERRPWHSERRLQRVINWKPRSAR